MSEMCGASLEAFSRRIAAETAVCLCQLGEFGFVFSSHCHMSGLISTAMHKTLLGATAVSLLVTPFVIRWANVFIHSHYFHHFSNK